MSGNLLQARDPLGLEIGDVQYHQDGDRLLRSEPTADGDGLNFTELSPEDAPADLARSTADNVVDEFQHAIDPDERLKRLSTALAQIESGDYSSIEIEYPGKGVVEAVSTAAEHLPEIWQAAREGDGSALLNVAATALTGAVAGSLTGGGKKKGKKGKRNGGEKEASREVTVSASRHPQSAKHIKDAQAAGKPSTLTID